jgi:GAF domain-containing protein
VALFVPGQAGLSMHLAWAAGRLAGYLSELRPELGRGLSGWVAAHRRSLINADGELEFRDSLGIPVVPRCVLSLPVEFGASQTVGVLTLYSDTEAFTAADHELLQALAHAIGNCPSPSQPDRSAPGPASATAGQAEHADERLAS